MITVVIIDIAILVILTFIELFLSITYCDPGFMGYPDKWRSETAERIYYIIAPIQFIWMIGSIIFGCIITI